MSYIVNGNEFDDLAAAAYEIADPIFEHFEGELLEFLAERWPAEYKKAEELDLKENGYSGYEVNPSLSQFTDCIGVEDGQTFLEDIQEYVDSVPLI